MQTLAGIFFECVMWPASLRRSQGIEVSARLTDQHPMRSGSGGLSVARTGA